MTVTFAPPVATAGSAHHHSRAAAENEAAAKIAKGQLLDAINDHLAPLDHIALVQCSAGLQHAFAQGGFLVAKTHVPSISAFGLGL